MLLRGGASCVPRAPCSVIYWGDIDTHGLVIFDRARAALPSVSSMLMDEETLFAHRDLWGTEEVQSVESDLP